MSGVRDRLNGQRRNGIRVAGNRVRWRPGRTTGIIRETLTRRRDGVTPGCLADDRPDPTLDADNVDAAQYNISTGRSQRCTDTIFRPGNGYPSATDVVLVRVVVLLGVSVGVVVKVFDLLKLFHFITDRYQTLHTHTRRHSPQSHRGGFST